MLVTKIMSRNYHGSADGKQSRECFAYCDYPNMF